MVHVYTEKNKKLSVRLEEDIDVNTCKTIRTIIDGYIIKYNPKVFELDMKKVEFMDSSGIGFVVGRRNLANMLNCKFELLNVNANIKRLLQMYDEANKKVKKC